ncbi:MAG: hypothetical protein OES79_10280 [Planctomycetota bacterium]|nr:hypothetical protein [Planctomycetota bacterium]
MSEIPDRNTLLDEIEIRQDDLLRQLDDLNQRIEVVLREQSAAMGLGSHATPAVPGENPAPAVETPRPAAIPLPGPSTGSAHSVAAVQMPGLVDGQQQPQAQHQANDAA